LDGSLVKGLLIGPQCSYSEPEAKQMLIANGFPEATVELSEAINIKTRLENSNF
jgi:hypothetical protein